MESESLQEARVKAAHASLMQNMDVKSPKKEGAKSFANGELAVPWAPWIFETQQKRKNLTIRFE